MKGVAEAIQILGLAKLVLDMVISLYKKVTPPRHEANLNDDFDFIKAEFEIMEAHLADAAEGNGYRSHVARTWVRQVRDLTYDVEDCFQEFIVHLERPPRSPSKQKPRKKAVDEIRSLKQKIKESNMRYRDSFPVSASAAGAGHDPHKLLATIDSFASKPNLLIGRETEKSRIIQIVTKHGRIRQIIPIWGMGGIGKTVLAKSIYEDQVTIGMFQKFAWINLSHHSSEPDCVSSLIMQLQKADMRMKETLKKMDLKDLIEESNKLLRSGSYIVVLDNVSSINQWNFLKLLFQEEENASRIIVTTREKSVAEHCSTENIYKLEALNDDTALELFKTKVVMESSYFQGRPEMVKQAKCILDKCNGLPLAISSVGDFLATKPKTAPVWEKFNDQFSSELEKNPSLARLRMVLASHYEDLPHHLKFCFLYLSIFPKDQNMIRRRRLLRRWIAEGYASGTHNMSAEENGDDYFADLISRSIIQPSKSAAGSGVSVDYCHVHKLIHEIGVSQSMKEKFSVVLGNRSSLYTQDTIRHLSISCSWKRDANELKSIGDMSQLRSLTVCGEWKTFLISENMRMLRVLDLEGTEGVMDHHVKQVTKFIHLKYLSLRGCSGIFWLPDSLGNLWDLQTLDVRGTSIIALPTTIVKLRKLQYLRAGYIPEDEQGRDPFDESAAMEGEDEMPKALNTALKWTVAIGALVAGLSRPQLVNNDTNREDVFNITCRNIFPILAWRLDKHGVEVPPGIGNLSCLQTLGVVNVGAKKFISAELGNVTQLRKLGVTGIKRENSPQLFSTIAKLTLLQSLSMRSEGETGLQGCLDGQSLLPGNLRSLKLYGNLVTFPTWISRLENLAKLTLRSTRLEQDAIQVLGKLPHLAILRLLSNSVVGQLWTTRMEQDVIQVIWKFPLLTSLYLDFLSNSAVAQTVLGLSFQRGDFPALVVLQLDGLPDLLCVEFEQGAASKLELLQVKGCTNIDVDGFSGLLFLQNLKEFSLKASNG
ncbi:unnamed protein product [Urochloa decumbens]|uniref:Uncharacterized protein n=1 Tax=Urochloa decumbens TaxID=240449 RepID=A0ABC9D800_9POAL